MFKHKVLAATISAAFPLFCTAQSTANGADSTIALGEVVVQTKRTGPIPTRSVLSSVDVLSGTIAAEQNVRYSWELLGRVPGVQLTDMGQGAVSGGFSFRGFNGEREINAVKLLIDGVPSNNNAGNMPYFDMIFPLDIESIEVVRGTNDPRYGLHNIAGNVNITTRLGSTYNEARASIGSFGSRDIQFSKGIETDGFSQNYFVGIQHANGYRDHSNSDKASLGGKWFFNSADGRVRTGLIARYYENKTEEPGYMTLAEVRNDPWASAARNATDGGNRKLGQVSGHLDMELNERLFWSSKVYVNHINDRRWVTFAPGNRQQERFEDETHIGALTTVTYRPNVAWAYDVAIEGGLSTEHQENKSDRFTTTNRLRTAQTRNQDFDFNTSGAFVQAVIRPTENLKFIPAYRVDVIRGTLRDTNGVSYDIHDYGTIGQPKLSAVYAFNDAYAVYGNWGRTFQVGVGAGSYNTANSDVGPSINNGWETGIKFKPAEWIEGRIAVWQQVASNEARRRLGAANNDVENIGKTQRRGIDLQANMKPTRDLSIWLGYSIQKSRILTPDNATPLSRDKEIDHVPRHLASGGVDYQLSPQWKLSYWANGQGDYYLERTNTTGKFGGYFLSNVGATFQWSKDLSIEMQIKNVTDRYWEYVWHDGVQSLHAPGSPRAFYVSMNAKF